LGKKYKYLGDVREAFITAPHKVFFCEKGLVRLPLYIYSRLPDIPQKTLIRDRHFYPWGCPESLYTFIIRNIKLFQNFSFWKSYFNYQRYITEIIQKWPAKGRMLKIK